MNTVSLIGRFAADPELRYTTNGTAVCNFTLAVRNPFNKDQEADFIQCVAWQNGAELIAEKHIKGNMIGIDGRIATRNYDNDEGKRVYVTEVNVSSIHLIQTKDYEENKQKANSQQKNTQQKNQSNGSRSNSNRNSR